MEKVQRKIGSSIVSGRFDVVSFEIVFGHHILTVQPILDFVCVFVFLVLLDYSFSNPHFTARLGKVPF